MNCPSLIFQPFSSAFPSMFFVLPSSLLFLSFPPAFTLSFPLSLLSYTLPPSQPPFFLNRFHVLHLLSSPTLLPPLPSFHPFSPSLPTLLIPYSLISSSLLQSINIFTFHCSDSLLHTFSTPGFALVAAVRSREQNSTEAAGHAVKILLVRNLLM